MSEENRAATATENNQELVASTNDHEVDDDPHTNLTQPMATSEDDNMEAPSTDEAKDTPSQLNHLDSGIGMMEEDDPVTPKSADDVKTGFVKAAVEHIEKQSGIDAPVGSSLESVKAVESIPNIQAMPPKKRKTEETQADEGCLGHMTAFDPTKPVFGVSLSGHPSENASSINNTLKEAKVTPGVATVEDKIMAQMESIHGPTEQGDKASTSSGTSADDTAASNTSAAVGASGDNAAEPAAKRFKVDMHVQRDAVNNYDAKIVHHTLAGQTPANSPTSSPSHRTCQMPPTVQYSGGNDSYSSHVAAANALDQTLSAKQAQTTPLAFPTLPVNLQPNRAAVIQPPVLANREQALEGSLDETPPVAKRQLFAGGPSAHTGYKQGPALMGHNQVPVLMGYKQKKDRVSYSKKSGISFPVSRTMAKLRKGRYANHIQIKAGIYMAAVLEYLVAEVLELSGAFAKIVGMKLREFITIILFVLRFQGSAGIRTIYVYANASKNVNAGCLEDCGDHENIEVDIDIPWPSQFSFCYRYHAKTWAGKEEIDVGTDMFTIGKKTVTDGVIRMEEGIFYGTFKSALWLAVNKIGEGFEEWIEISTVPDPFPVLTWKHRCVNIDLTTGDVIVHRRGGPILNNTLDQVPDVFSKYSGNVDYIGIGAMRSLDGGMATISQYTDVQVFSRLLSDAEIQEYFDCRNREGSAGPLRGDIASWQSTRFYIHSPYGHTTESEQDIADICKPMENAYFHIPVKTPYNSGAQQFCSRFSADLVEYGDEADFDKLVSSMADVKYVLMNEGACVKKIEDSETEYKYNFYTGATNIGFRTWETPRDVKAVSHIPWDEGRPWDGIWLCLLVNIYMNVTGPTTGVFQHAKITDERCDMPVSCPTCISKNPVITLKIKGLCQISKLNRIYNVVWREDGNIMFLGEISSEIVYDHERNVWNWTDANIPGGVATIDKPFRSMLIGRNKVDFTNMKEGCLDNAKEDEKIIDITLTTCKDDDFTCHNGQCIPIASRCNQFENCADGSDERDCKSLVIKNNYNRKIPPFRLDPSNNEIKKADVNISVDVVDMLSLTEVDLEFECKFKLVMEWTDYRLEFWNLKVNDEANALSTEEENQIWVPTLVFSNTKENDITESENKAILIVGRRAAPKPSDSFEEIDIFSGEDSILKLQRIYTKEFRCVYQLSMYPFDTQICTIDLDVDELAQFGVQLIPSDIHWAGETILTSYVVKNYTLDYTNMEDPNEGLFVKLTLKRRLFSEIMTTFLPSALILIIVYCSNFFKDFFFETVIMLNLTALLVLTTLFVSVSSYLPKTAYLKMIDIWLLFAQFIPFFEVLLHTFIDSQRKMKEDKEVESAKWMRRIAEANEKKNNLVHPMKSPQIIEVKDANGFYAKDLVTLDEKAKTDNRKNFYDGLDTADENNFLRIAEMIARKGTLTVCLLFSAVFWTIGLSHYISN